MKKTITIAIVGLLVNISIYAASLSQEDIKQWNQIGVPNLYLINKWRSYEIDVKEAEIWIKAGYGTKKLREIWEWKKVGINDPREIIKWEKLGVRYYKVKKYISKDISPEILKSWNDAGIDGKDMLQYMKNGINTIKEAKAWKDVNVYPYHLKDLEKANITKPIQLKDWKDAGINHFDMMEWAKLGITSAKEAKAWKEVSHINDVKDWKRLNLTPSDVKQWKSLKLNSYSIMQALNMGLDYKTTKKWVDYGIKRIEDISLMKNGGFSNPSEFKPYKGIYLDHAVKLKKWDIKPDDLIKSMSYSNTVFGQELYFMSKDRFNKAYSALEDQCDEIVKDKWFTTVDMSQNKNKCYIFVGKMIQRLDESSMFSGTTQKGLVSGTGKRYFFADAFKGDWRQGNTNVGVIKGSGSYSYESRTGTRVVPKGTVIYIK